MSILPCGVINMAVCGVANSSLTSGLFHLDLKIGPTSILLFALPPCPYLGARIAHALALVTFDLFTRYLAHAGKAVTSLPEVLEV